MDIEAVYRIGRYWGPESNYAEVPSTDVVATVRRKGRLYTTHASFIPVADSRVLCTLGRWDITPKPRKRALRTEILAALREHTETWQDSPEYLAKVVEARRHALSTRVHNYAQDVIVATENLKRSRQRLAEARRKLKAFERKNP